MNHQYQLLSETIFIDDPFSKNKDDRNVMDISWKRWLSGGISLLINVVNDEKYGVIEKGPVDKTFSAPSGIPVGRFVRKTYMLNLNKCLQQCGNQDKLCRDKCTNIAAIDVLRRIKRDIMALGKIKNQEQKAKLNEKLMKQARMYMSKRQKVIENKI